jgi:N-acetylmuramoyl-L-alanine amidase
MAGTGHFDAGAGQSITQVGAVGYLDLGQFLGRFGLRATWLEANKRLKFESAWTQIEFEVDSREILYNDRRVFLGDGILLRDAKVLVGRWDAQNLLAPLLNPAAFMASARPVKRIMIDAGHGGKDGGTTNAKLKLMEKTFALDVSQRLGAILSSQGFEVRYTREDDTYLGLAERAILTNAAQADLFVSVHFNAAGKTTVSGLETYTMTPQFQRSTSSPAPDPADNTLEPGHAHGPWNTILGFSMHRALLQKLKASDRGLKRARFAVLRLAECPAVLVEAGYLSNSQEARMIATPAYRAEIAEGLANGITAYANQLSALPAAP